MIGGDTRDISKLSQISLAFRATREIKYNNFEISLVVFMPNITYKNHTIICLYYCPQTVCNFHM